MSTDYEKGQSHAMASHYFDPPYNQQGREEYRAGYKAGHDQICNMRGARKILKRWG